MIMVDLEVRKRPGMAWTMWMKRIQAESVEPLSSCRCEWIALSFFRWFVVNIVIIVINIVICCVCVWIGVRASIRQTRRRHKWIPPSAIQQNSTLFWLPCERRMLTGVAVLWIGPPFVLFDGGNIDTVATDDGVHCKINVIELERWNY